LQFIEHLKTQTPEELGVYPLRQDPHLPLLHLSQFEGQGTHLLFINYNPEAHAVHDVISLLKQSEHDAEQPRHPPLPFDTNPFRHVSQFVALVQAMQFFIQFKHVPEL
jgi:hypothetical protein